MNLGRAMFKRDKRFDAENYTITVPSSDKMKTIAVFTRYKFTLKLKRTEIKYSTRPVIEISVCRPGFVVIYFIFKRD